MIKSILLAVDGSAYTEPVLQHGIKLAKKFGAHLRVLTVIDVRIFEWAVAVGVEGFAPILPSTSYQEDSQRLLEQKADEVLKKTESILKEHKVNFTLIKGNGNPVEIICDKSKLVDLVIMGARGEFEKWSDKMLGATLEATTRLNIKPIFITQRSYREINKILIAYDGSENASKALTYGAYFASQLNTPLTVLNVGHSEEDARSILSEALEYLSVYDIPSIQDKYVEGEPSEKIVENAKSLKADLIVMGSYGHSRIREAILGSTTVQVMRKSPVPILMTK
ncbi:MAG TPA: universal stress protein [Bacteroidetes bacterium]|nr:universal stress protein [Bacteroidota bacterium]